MPLQAFVELVLQLGAEFFYSFFLTRMALRLRGSNPATVRDVVELRKWVHHSQLVGLA